MPLFSLIPNLPIHDWIKISNNGLINNFLILLLFFEYEIGVLLYLSFDNIFDFLANIFIILIFDCITANVNGICSWILSIILGFAPNFNNILILSYLL